MNLSTKILALLLICGAIVLIVWGIKSIVPPFAPPVQSVADTAPTKHNNYPRYPQYHINRTTPYKAPKPKSPHHPIEINSADSTTLTLIKGIGPTFARRITAYRSRLGGFTDVTQLLEIKGLDSAKLQQIISQIKIDTTLCLKFDLRTCPAKIIQEHPYISPSLRKRILKRRGSLDELLLDDIILPREAKKLGAYFY